MIINYLLQFWNAITSAAVGTIEYFQSLGNAVAGAIGNVVLTPAHYVVDFFLVLSFLFENLRIVFYSILLYLNYIFIYFKEVITKIDFSTAANPFAVLPTDAITFFNSIPYFSTFTGVIIAGVMAIALIKILEMFRNI